MIKQALIKAIRTLTFSSAQAREIPTDPRELALYLISFPLVGVLFGILGWLVVRMVFRPLPMLCAWLVVAIWFAFSGAKQGIDLYRVTNAIFYSGSEKERAALLGKTVLGLRALGVVGFVYLGKMLALIQAQLLDVHTVSVLVLLTPIFSRYLYSILLLAADGERTSLSTVGKIIIGGSSLVVIILSSLAFTLGLFLVVAGMFVALLTKIWSEKRMGSFQAPVAGAVVELSEAIMFWAVVIAGAAGINLALVR